MLAEHRVYASLVVSPTGNVTHTSSIIGCMGDMMNEPPNHVQLFEIAAEQLGYFTAGEARDCGFSWNLLSHHSQGGRFIRVRRGLYRFRDFPPSRHEDVMAAWLSVGKDTAVVSHESALELLDLSDVIPSAIHVTVPRARRHLPALSGVTIHTTTRPIESRDITIREGIRLTVATRTILDVVETGVAPEQVELAISQAIERGLATEQQLSVVARERSRRVRDLIAHALQLAER